jgi:hypothetical protein
LLLGRFYETIGIKAGVKPKLDNPCPEPKLGDIDLEWAKIRPITTRKNFDKVHFRMFISNIERG